MKRSHVTTHVLDAAAGRPAAGVTARLDGLRGDAWEEIAQAVTDDDGRISAFGPEQLDAGTYRIEFAVGEYFARTGTETFYPSVTLTFALADPAQHYHVPLLLSPFAYSTYRGS
ncbi:5-hydroxyisourate hydrolase precursor [Arthrobacter saudimassiliensis]|uniref:5-hydroxyisourate hydrolase n=1 Tax=Arthrobacter saudimassiliensis TaxID=1461584 RepID=A0A078MQG8_9MICC|nr:5-hydroxyisourate hydrolase precursor [Arthrobacter saudimassiliensis]